MSEVYCKDCKFLHRNTFDYGILTCERKYGIPYKVKDSIKGEIEEANLLPVLHPTIRNNDLNCGYFEPRLMVRIWNMINI